MRLRRLAKAALLIVLTYAGKHEPDFVIGDARNPYMRRWRLLPENRLVNIFIHHIMRSDDDRALHDHPFDFVSFILENGYWEHTTGGGREAVQAGRVLFRRATHRHRLALFATLRPAWTLVLRGPTVREWGFWCGSRFVPWYKFVANPNDPRGSVTGQGCA